MGVFVVVGVAVSVVLIVLPLRWMTRNSRSVTTARERAAYTAPGAPTALRMAADGSQWWDGAGWVRSDSAAPTGALWSPDGGLWYDGLDWHAVASRG